MYRLAFCVLLSTYPQLADASPYKVLHASYTYTVKRLATNIWQKETTPSRRTRRNQRRLQNNQWRPQVICGRFVETHYSSFSPYGTRRQQNKKGAEEAEKGRRKKIVTNINTRLNLVFMFAVRLFLKAILSRDIRALLHRHSIQN